MFSEIYCVVIGKVQGVGYRDFVERLAREEDLFGWVKNRSDGAVELLIQGTPDVLKNCLEKLYVGSPLARVDSIAVDWRTPEKQYEDFSVISG